MTFFYDALNAVADEIRALNLPGLDADRVKVRRLPNDGEHYFPGITVHPVTETTAEGTNMMEDIGYGCAITMVMNNNNAQDYLLDRLLEWRETIRRYFAENVTLGVMGAVCTIKVEFGNVIDWNDLLQGNYDVSRLIVRVWNRESRI